MAVEIVKATPALLCEVAALARRADREELWAAAHLTPFQVVMRAGVFGDAWVGILDGSPICAFGVVPISASTGWGAPWMVGTVRLDRHARGFLSASREVVAELLAHWPRLTNYVDARNTRAIRWLKWLGFAFQPAEPWGADGLPFHRFEMRGNHV